MQKKHTKQFLTEDLIRRIRNGGIFNGSDNSANKYWSDLMKKYYIQDELLIDYYFRIDWYSAAIHQILSEDLIVKIEGKIHLDHLVWQNLYKYQKLSYDFMYRNRGKLNFEDDIVFSVCINNTGKIPNKLTDFLFKQFRAGLWDDVLFSTVDITNKQYLEEVAKIQDERLNMQLSSAFTSVPQKAHEVEDEDFKLS